MRALLAFCRRLAIDFAAVLFGWASLDVAWDWFMGDPIARNGWVRYLLPTIAAALTASLARYLRPGPVPQVAGLPGKSGWRDALSVDWADMLALLASYEAAGRLPPLLRWLDPASLRLTATVVLAVVLGLLTAYVLHWLLAEVERRRQHRAAPATSGNASPLASSPGLKKAFHGPHRLAPHHHSGAPRTPGPAPGARQAQRRRER